MEIKIMCSYSKMEPVENLKRHEHNDRLHSNDASLNERLAKTIEYQGWRFSILCSKLSGKIICGHARLEAAKILGMKEVPVDWQEFTNEDQEIAQLVADTALQEWRDIDLSAVNEIVIPHLDGINFDIDLLGIKDFVVEPMDKYDLENEEKEKMGKGFVLEVTFSSEDELTNVYNDLCSKGYIVKVK